MMVEENELDYLKRSEVGLVSTDEEDNNNSMENSISIEENFNNEIEEISFEKALSVLLRQTYIPADIAKMKKTLTLVAKLKERVKFYKYVFNNMKDDAFEVAYSAIVDC